jgi:hypothetical protein
MARPDPSGGEQPQQNAAMATTPMTVAVGLGPGQAELSSRGSPKAPMAM